jgi:aryl-alcohol dehydrogenase-like predicted oxidoreductase
MTFGEQGGVGAPLAECRRMLDAYAEAGGNVIDTAVNWGSEHVRFATKIALARRMVARTLDAGTSARPRHPHRDRHPRRDPLTRRS